MLLRLTLRRSNGRTLLLFVIRDHIGTTPLANLQATLTADLNRIWKSLSKPQDLQDRQLSDYFDLAFTALPHKVLAADKFEADVKTLRERFVNKEAEGYIFKPSYHKRIPADGVAFYMENIWVGPAFLINSHLTVFVKEQVQTNKDLDLPTQQELLAQFRCDEISAVALSAFNDLAKSQKRPIEAGKVVDALGEMMRTWRKESLSMSFHLLNGCLTSFPARYDRDASRYHQDVYKRKRADLIASLDSILSPLFLGQLKNLHKFCLVAFKKEMLDGMKGEEYNFAEVVKDARTRCEKRFVYAASEAVIEESDQWSWVEELELLKEEVNNVASQCRKDETKKMVNAIEVGSTFLLTHF